eukprot:CAMPEP_0197849706 /NCGR_PEP_ID=MMETSP1438-20131217/12942_1 /TAXON_ID=1461541 /ORGANISM="Pterosperma sp., Strain CCMP1384" /LENGTH=1600 /DNA_ID=CAMNT_0043462499 /DNA_START=97 /DNA_END=4896 /DNA_ORIENTATION=-
MNRNNGNQSTKYANSNLNGVYQKPNTGGGKTGGVPGQRHGMLLLGNKTTRARAATGASKLAVPKPVNLPSIKKEHAGNDPTTQLVPTGGSGGGWKTDELKEHQQPKPVQPVIPTPGLDTKPLAAGSTWGSALSSRNPTPAEAAAAVPYAAYGPASRSSSGRPERLNPAEYPTLGTAASQPARSAPPPQSQVSQREDRHWDDDERHTSSIPSLRPQHGPGDWYRRDGDDDRYDDERRMGRGPPVGGGSGSRDREETPEDFGFGGPSMSFAPRSRSEPFGPSALLGDNAPFERRAPFAEDEVGYFGASGPYGRSSLVDDWKPPSSGGPAGQYNNGREGRYGPDDFNMPVPGARRYGPGSGPRERGSQDGPVSPKAEGADDAWKDEKEEVDLARQAYQAEVAMVARMQEEERERKMQEEKMGKKGGPRPPPPPPEEEAPKEPTPSEPIPAAQAPSPPVSQAAPQTDAPVMVGSPPRSSHPPRAAIPPGARTAPASLDAITASSALVAPQPKEAPEPSKDQAGTDQPAERKGPRLGALKPRSEDAEKQRRQMAEEEERAKASAKAKLAALEQRIAARKKEQEDKVPAEQVKNSPLLDGPADGNSSTNHGPGTQISGGSWRANETASSEGLVSSGAVASEPSPADTTGIDSHPADEELLDSSSLPNAPAVSSVPSSSPPNAWGNPPAGTRPALEAWGPGEGTPANQSFPEVPMNLPPGMNLIKPENPPSDPSVQPPQVAMSQGEGMNPQMQPPGSMVPALGPLFNVSADPLFGAPLGNSEGNLRNTPDMNNPGNMNSALPLNLGPMNQVMMSGTQHQQASNYMQQGVPPGVIPGGRPAWQDGPGAMFTGGPLGGMILPPHPGMPAGPYGTGMPGFQPQHMGLGGMPPYSGPDGLLPQVSAGLNDSVTTTAPTLPPGMPGVLSPTNSGEAPGGEASEQAKAAGVANKKGGKGRKGEDSAQSKEKGRKGKETVETAVAGSDESRGKGRGKGVTSPAQEPGKKDAAAVVAGTVPASGKSGRTREGKGGKGADGKGTGRKGQGYRMKSEAGAEGADEVEDASEAISDVWPGAESEEFVEVRSKKAVQTEKREQRSAAPSVKENTKGAGKGAAKGGRKDSGDASAQGGNASAQIAEPTSSRGDSRGGKGKREPRNPRGVPKSPTLSGQTEGSLPAQQAEGMQDQGLLTSSPPGISMPMPPSGPPPGLVGDSIPAIHPWRSDQQEPSLSQIQLEESRAVSRADLVSDLLPATLETSPDKKEMRMMKGKEGSNSAGASAGDSASSGDMFGNGPPVDNLPADLSLGDMGPTRVPLPPQMPYGLSGPMPPSIPPPMGSMGGFPQFGPDGSGPGMDMGSAGAWVQSQQPVVTSGQDSFYATPAAFRSTFAPPQQGFVPQAFPGQLGGSGQPFGMPFNQFGGMSSFSYLPTGKQPDWKHTPSSSSGENSFGMEPQMQMQRSVNEPQWGQSFGLLPPGLPGGPGVPFDPQGGYPMGVMPSQPSSSQPLSTPSMMPGANPLGGMGSQQPSSRSIQPPQFPDELGAIGFIESMGTSGDSSSQGSLQPAPQPAQSQPPVSLQNSSAAAGGMPSGQMGGGRRGKGQRSHRSGSKGGAGKGN